MNRRLILIVALFFTSTVFAGNWFVGVNGGGNITKSSPVGDLPMAREEFEFNDQREEDNQIFSDLVNTQGLSLAEALELRKDLNLLSLEYSTGWNMEIYGGYSFKYVSLGLRWNHIHSKYKSINGGGMNKGEAVPHWILGDSSGKTIINTFLLFTEYEILDLQFSKITPVVGVGFGVTMKATDILIFDGEKAKREQKVFAYQIKAGINYNFTKQLQGNIGTAFFGTSKIKATNNYIKQWQFINLGVRWIFD